MRTRLDYDLRRGVLLRAALDVAGAHGLAGLTHCRVAEAAGCSARTVYRWARNRKRLRVLVVECARARGIGEIVVEAATLRL